MRFEEVGRKTPHSPALPLLSWPMMASSAAGGPGGGGAAPMVCQRKRQRSILVAQDVDSDDDVVDGTEGECAEQLHHPVERRPARQLERPRRRTIALGHAHATL